jgi:hypothetical protein
MLAPQFVFIDFVFRSSMLGIVMAAFLIVRPPGASIFAV